MPRPSWIVATAPLLAIAAVLYGGRSQDAVDRVQGIRVSSRLHCDGSTNPQEELGLETSFSAGGSPRAFHLDIFQDRYCKRFDLYFFCVMHGHDRWKHEWEKSNLESPGIGRLWVNACSAWGSADPRDYILSAWYQEGPGGRKAPWKQAALKPVPGAPETFEFSDAAGGTARLKIKRK